MDQNNFLEVCALGDIQTAREMLKSGQIDINFANKMNGWTGLHWATRRGHVELIKFLLQNGADPTLITKKRESAEDLAPDGKIRAIFGNTSLSSGKSEPDSDCEKKNGGFTPNYMKNPDFIYAKKPSRPASNGHTPRTPVIGTPDVQNFPKSIKVRLPETDDSNAIYKNVDIRTDNFDEFMLVVCQAVNVIPASVKHVLKNKGKCLVGDKKDLEDLIAGEEIVLVLEKESFFEKYHDQLVGFTGAILIIGLSACVAFYISNRRK